MSKTNAATVLRASEPIKDLVAAMRRDAAIISDRADELYRLVKANEAGLLSDQDLAAAAKRLYPDGEVA